MPQQGSSPVIPRPVAQVPLRVGAIPKSLKKLDRWILWKYTFLEKTQKWTKTPHSALSGHKVDATNFANGVSFTDATTAFRTSKGRFDGIGFMLGAGIAGIDVDDCIDENGNLDERGQKLSKAYRGTYAEVSPSGQGFKILVNIGDDPKLALIGKNTGDTEIYGGTRYFTVTGGILPGHVGEITTMADAFRGTAEEMGATKDRIADMPMDKGKEILNIGLKGARELLDHLPFIWCDSYSEWIKSGMALHHEFSGSAEALELWDEWSQRNPTKYDAGGCALKWETFGKPGKDDVTLRTLVREAQSTGWRAPRTIDDAVRDFSPFDEPARDIDPDTGEAGPLNWWQKFSIGRMLTEPAPEKQWIWKGVLRVGKVMILAGSGGSSKSYLMLGAAVQYSLGNSWGPFELADNHSPGRVLLMYGEEDHADAHDRTQVLRHTFMLDDKQIEQVGARLAVLPLRGAHVQLAKMGEGYSRTVEMTEQLTRLEQRISEYNIKLVVLDPLAMFHSLEENDNVSIAALVSGLDAMCMRQGCSLILVHHFGKVGVNKATEVNESNVRGASALVAHARTVVIMHRLREDEAVEWGVPEQDHSRWVMWAIVKNNYGPSGGRSWFNVDPQTGAIAPAPQQLERRSPLDIRAAVQAARVEQEISEVSDLEARQAAERAAEEIALNGRVMTLLQYALREGKLPSTAKAIDVFSAAGLHNLPARKVRTTTERIRASNFVDTDGMVNAAGREWMAQHELLS